MGDQYFDFSFHKKKTILMSFKRKLYEGKLYLDLQIRIMWFWRN